MNQSERQRHTIAVVGAGSWGTAVGAWLARNGHDVRIWDVDQSVIEDIQKTRTNSRYLQNCELPENLEGHLTLETAMHSCSTVVLVVPSRFFQQALDTLHPHIHLMDKTTRPVLVWGTKGFDSSTGNLLSSAVENTFRDSVAAAVLSGPSFAIEVVRGMPTGFDLASRATDKLESIANLFRNPVSLVYTTDDVVGVQIGGATKNVIAIAAGISDGLNFGINARSLLISRGFAEMNRLNQALGGRPETLMGLSGMGDLILTCTGDLSRNRRLGLGLGRGESLQSILDEIGQEVEGLQSTRETYSIGRELDVFMPMTDRVYRILYENLSPLQAAQELLDIGPSLGTS